MSDFLHIYGQGSWHSPVHIIGTRAELVKLMTAINRSLYFPDEIRSETTDGEGYLIRVVALDGPEYKGREVRYPYVEHEASDRRDKVWRVYDLWRDLRKHFGFKV